MYYYILVYISYLSFLFKYKNLIFVFGLFNIICSSEEIHLRCALKSFLLCNFE